MNALAKKLVLAGFVLTLVVTSDSLVRSQDPGTKFRGKQGAYFGTRPEAAPTYSAPTMRPRESFSYEPAERAATRRSYSYAPAPFHVGDYVTVVPAEAKLLKGNETLAVLKKGEVVEVRKVNGPWVGIVVEKGGVKISGWIWKKHVKMTTEKPAARTETTTATRPRVERRAFSYEPSMERSRNYRTYAPSNKPSWDYPKTDPRRYQSRF